MARVLISGAGIAGLTAALWFQRYGFEPVVIERAPHPRGGGYLVSLSHFAYQYADELGVLKAMQERNMGITHSSYHDMTGRELLALDYQRLFAGVDVLQIMRDDVVDVLYQQAKSDIQIRFNESIEAVTEASEAVQVEFASGQQEHFDLLVIAEGQNSSTRNLVFPNDVSLDYLDLHCAAMRIPNTLGLSHKFETHMDQGRYMAAFNTPDGGLGCVFVWSSAERQIPAGPDKLSALEAAFRGSAKAIDTALDSASAEGIYMDSLKQVNASTWHRGRTILIGDAAHCLTLFSGRGAAAAIAGATRLARQVKQSGIVEGIREFETESRKILGPIQHQTKGAVRWYVPQTRTDRWLRNNGMRFLPNRLFEQYFKMKYSNV